MVAIFKKHSVNNISPERSQYPYRIIPEMESEFISNRTWVLKHLCFVNPKWGQTKNYDQKTQKNYIFRDSYFEKDSQIIIVVSS